MQFVLTGFEQAGLSISAALLNCSSDININMNQPLDDLHQTNDKEIYFLSITMKLLQEKGLGLLDCLVNFALSNQVKFVWITRNPLDSSHSCVSKSETSPDMALEYWFRANLILWYFFHSIPAERWIRVRFEDILMNKKEIKKMFRFCDTNFHSQYLTYGDFDQPHNNDPVFQGGIIDYEYVDRYDKTKFRGIWNKYINSSILSELDYE